MKQKATVVRSSQCFKDTAVLRATVHLEFKDLREAHVELGITNGQWRYLLSSCALDYVEAL